MIDLSRYARTKDGQHRMIRQIYRERVSEQTAAGWMTILQPAGKRYFARSLRDDGDLRLPRGGGCLDRAEDVRR